MTDTEAGWVSLTTCLAAGIVTLATIWLWRSCQVLMTFKRMGVPGPMPIPLFGNMLTMIRQGFAESFPIWTKQYGKIYGIFLPGGPGLVISDLDIIKDIAVKKFSQFPNRLPQEVFKFKPWSGNLLALRGDHWKHVRGILSPTFSSGKLRKMAPAIERVVFNLADNVTVKAKQGEMVELKEFCSSFAMDVFAGAAFGLQVDSVKNPKDPFICHAHNMLFGRQWLLPFIVTFPFLVPLFYKIGLTLSPKETTDFFYDVTENALKERLKEKEKFSDFLQLLVDAEKELEKQHEVDAEIDHRSQLHTSTQWTRKGLTRDEIHSNSLVFLFAGFDTVSTAMSYTLFCLAANPECLCKAQQEVDEKLGKKLADYTTANELVYLDMCLNEALRMFTPAFVVDRQCAEDTEVEGCKVPEGMLIFFPAHAIHNDPQIWPNPTKYDPERHRPEARATRHPCSFLPFGLGPRNCIGMRLAQLEIRMALAAVLQRVTPVLCEKSVVSHGFNCQARYGFNQLRTSINCWLADTSKRQQFEQTLTVFFKGSLEEHDDTFVTDHKQGKMPMYICTAHIHIHTCCSTHYQSCVCMCPCLSHISKLDDVTFACFPHGWFLIACFSIPPVVLSLVASLAVMVCG